MVRAVFICNDRERREVACPAGESLMHAAKAAGVPGIDADCGGSMVCGTCHVYVDPRWKDRLQAPSEMEATILEFVPTPHPDARLSCQLVASRELDAIELRVPPAQR